MRPTKAYSEKGPNRVHETAILTALVEMGIHNQVDAYTVIGTPAQIRPDMNQPVKVVRYAPVKIGDRNIIRELVSIHDGVTIGDENYIMAHTHIGHDGRIGSSCTLAAPKIAGHVTIMDRANIGLNATIHQRVTIGAMVMVGMGAVVVDDIPPFTKAIGNPARVVGWNTVGMQRAGLSEEAITRAQNRETWEWVIYESTRCRRAAREWFGDEQDR